MIRRRKSPPPIPIVASSKSDQRMPTIGEPNAKDLVAQYKLLDDRALPFYEHRLVA
jgi:hypothetical protein